MSERLRHVVGATVWEFKTLVAEHPSVAIPLARLRGHGEIVDQNADIVVEAFVRSALSYAVAGFRLAQEPAVVHVAHHTHSPSALIDGLRHGVPSLLIVRAPEDAVLSYVVKTTDVSLRAALQGYIRFHRPLLPYGGDLAVATFEEVTSDLGAVIRRVNSRFGTSFVAYARSSGNEARIRAEIEADWKTRGRDDEERERGIPRPSAAREELKATRASLLHAPRLHPLLDRAEQIHRTFVALAVDR
ncbi:MAG TPA: hypothetical protein VGJ67_02235 [Actinomycetota bacterium]